MDRHFPLVAEAPVGEPAGDLFDPLGAQEGSLGVDPQAGSGALHGLRSPWTDDIACRHRRILAWTA